MNEEMKFCQSCGMPMQTAGDFGTEADGGASAGKSVCVIGDSTFMHSGITGLVNIAYNDSPSSIATKTAPLPKRARWKR